MSFTLKEIDGLSRESPVQIVLLPSEKRSALKEKNLLPLRSMFFALHYEDMPIQIYWKFYHQKLKIFR